MGWGGGSVSKELPCKHEDLSSSHRIIPPPPKKRGVVVAYAQNSSGKQVGTMGTGRALEPLLASQPSLAGKVRASVSKERERESKDRRGKGRGKRQGQEKRGGEAERAETCLRSPHQEAAIQKLAARSLVLVTRWGPAGSNESLVDVFVPKVTDLSWSR